MQEEMTLTKAKVNVSVLVSVSFESRMPKAFTFYNDMEKRHMVKKVLEKYGLQDADHKEYGIFNSEIECFIEEFEDLRDGQKLKLLKEENFQIVNQQSQMKKNVISNQADSISQLQTQLTSEITTIKEEVGVRMDDEEEEKILPFQNSDDNDFDTIPLHSEDISLAAIENQLYPDRKELKLRMNEWSIQKGFKLKFQTREQVLSTGAKISLLKCNKKTCPFLLEFRTQVPRKLKNQYSLLTSCPTHNHRLEAKDGASQITPEILSRLKFLKHIGVDVPRIVEIINEEFEKQFGINVIRYQLSKIKNVALGRPLEDAKKLMEMVKLDAEKRGTEWYSTLGEGNKLENFVFMTPRMKMMLDKFSDILIIDTSHKTNRFGLPFLDIVLINNYGKSCLCFVGLLKNQQTDTFQWALSRFRENLNTDPQVIFSDEDDALRNAIKKVFPQTTNFLCTWHVMQNLKKKALYLTRKMKKDQKRVLEEKGKLHKMIINLPHSNYQKDYLENFKAIISSKYVDKSFKDYLKKKDEERNIWVRCFMKEKLTCGTSTTSRIESKHRQLKRFLNDTTRLTEIFTIINELEEKEIQELKEDEEQTLKRKDKGVLDSNCLIKSCSENYSQYILEKFKTNFLCSMNYNVKKLGAQWEVEFHEKTHRIKKRGNKISCDCGDDIFFGIPCRHLIAVSNKSLKNNFEILPFSPRWHKSYFQALDYESPIFDSNNTQLEAKEKIPCENPDPAKTSGRPTSTSQRLKSASEKKSEKKSGQKNKKRMEPTSKSEDQDDEMKQELEYRTQPKRVKKSVK